MINLRKLINIVFITENNIIFNDLKLILNNFFGITCKQINDFKDLDLNIFDNKFPPIIFMSDENRNLKKNLLVLPKKIKDDNHFFLFSEKKTHVPFITNIQVPFKINVLINELKRISNIKLKKSFEFKSSNYEYSFDEASFKSKFNKKKIHLTEMENKLVNFLLTAKKGVNKKHILSVVWGYSKELNTHTLESLIYRLRKKIELDPQDPKILVYKKNKYFMKL